MKLYLGILASVLVVLQISSSQALLSTKKDETEHLDTFKKFQAPIKDIQPVIIAVIRDMPTSNGYSKYRQELDNVLQQLSEKSGKTCLEKQLQDLEKLDNLIKKYSKNDGSREAKTIVKLFLKNGYKSYLMKQWFRLHKVDLASFKENITKLDRADSKYKALTEVC